jgi:hypothetical protein
MSDEGGVMPSEEMHDISLINGRPFFRQRDSGHLAVPGWFSDTEPRLDRSSQCEPAHETNRWRCRVHVDRALKPCGHREGLCALPRSEPDSGNPTIRDRRGAWGNVAMAELGTHSATERAGLETLGLTSARPSSIPTLQERRQRLHPGLESCRRHREVPLEA